MKCFVAILFGFVVAGCAVAQDATPVKALVDSRQAEVERLAVMLYGFHMDQAGWMHRPVDVCPAFSHHAFARYDRTDRGGVVESVIAVYTLDTGPTRSMSKPWQGGIVLLPLFGTGHGDGTPAIESPATMTVFNHVWADEVRRAGQGSTFPGLSWEGLADCYVRLGNEQLTVNEASASAAPLPAIDLKGERVENELIPLASSGDKSRNLRLQFDKSGLITGAEVTEYRTH